jgi:hypothetical protein
MYCNCGKYNIESSTAGFTINYTPLSTNEDGGGTVKGARDLDGNA